MYALPVLLIHELQVIIWKPEVTELALPVYILKILSRDANASFHTIPDVLPLHNSFCCCCFNSCFFSSISFPVSCLDVLQNLGKKMESISNS